MKIIALSACLAVAAAVSAADLKDPALVAREWSQNTVQSLVPLTGDLSLKAQTSLTPTPFASVGPVVVSDCWPSAKTRLSGRAKGEVLETPSGWRLDPKILREVPGEMPSPGAKPWYYRGQKFWIVPIDSAEGPKTGVNK